MRKTCILVALLLLIHPVCEAVMLIQQRQAGSWQKAQAYCRQHYTDLVTIRDATENDFVFGSGWIGLYRNGSQWKWSNGDEIANFTMWKDGEPHERQNCAWKITKKKEWYSDVCGKQHRFTCYDEKLVLVNENKTWEDALKHCRALEAVKSATAYQNHRYDLATLNTKAKRVFAQRMARRASTNEVWMGLRYLAGRWLRVDGEKVHHNDVQRSATCQWHCGTLGKDVTKPFGTRNCKEKKNFLCYRKK